MVNSGKSTAVAIEHGGFISGSGAPAFRLLSSQRSPIPVLIAVPHAGRDYPIEIRQNMRDPTLAALRLEDRYVDRLALEVAQITSAPIITARAPRAMLDLNRSREDVDWGMVKGGAPEGHVWSQVNRRARSGLGLVPRRLPGLGEIWKRHMTREELTARIEGIHRPYHRALGRELDAIADKWGGALLLDFHSMPPLKKAFDAMPTARFVLGDRFGTSCEAGLSARGLRYLEAAGWAVAHNRPYAGGFTLDHHASPVRGINAMQIEICRSTYLDAAFNEPRDNYRELVDLLAGLVRELGIAMADLTRNGGYAQAAE